MPIDDAFAAGVRPATFVEEHLPELYEPWAAEFEKVSDVPVTIGLRLDGTGGGEWTLYADDTELDVEQGQGGKPLATFVGDAAFWDALRPEMARVANMIEASRGRDHRPIPAERRLNDRRLNALERLQGEIALTLSGVPGMAAPLRAVVVLNGFEPGRSRALTVSISYADLLQVLRAETTFKELASAGKIALGGDMGLPVKIAGAFV